MSFAADERHFEDAKARELPDHVERFVGAELVRARMPRPGTAVAAREVAAEGQLPDAVYWARHAVDRPRFVHQRQPTRAGRRGRERQMPLGSRRLEERGAFVGTHDTRVAGVLPHRRLCRFLACVGQMPTLGG